MKSGMGHVGAIVHAVTLSGAPVIRLDSRSQCFVRKVSRRPMVQLVWWSVG